MMGLGREMRRVGRKKFRLDPRQGWKGTWMMGIVGECMGKKTFLEQDIREAITDALIGMAKAVWPPNKSKDPIEDPTIFDITYRGRHTCNQVGGNPNPPAPPQNQEPNMGMNPFTQQGQPSETLLNFCRQLKVETSNLDNNNPQENQPFTYSYTLPSSSNINSDQSYGFRPLSMVDGNFLWSISPSFGSPASTTASSDFGCHPRLTTEAPPASTTSTGIIPAVSAANSPTVDPGFAFGTVGFDSNFTFDSRGLFPSPKTEKSKRKLKK